MSFYKVAVAFAVVALGAAALLALPSLSPDVDAGLQPSAVKADRVIAPEPTKPEPAKLEQTQPEPVKPEVVPEPVKPQQAKPQAKPKKGKVQQAKSAQGERRPTANAKGCADNTLSYYEVKCQRTRTRVVNGVRTTRVLSGDRPPQE